MSAGRLRPFYFPDTPGASSAILVDPGLVPLHRGFDGFQVNGGLGRSSSSTWNLNAARDARGHLIRTGAFRVDTI